MLPYVRDLPQVGRTPGAAGRLVLADLGGAPGSSARCCARRPTRSSGCSAAPPPCAAGSSAPDLDKTVHEFRVEQVVWGLVGVRAWPRRTACSGALADPARRCRRWCCALVAFVLGVLARDNHLSSQVKQRERRILAEFPTVAELLALAVAAGESPVGALDRVVRRSGGALSSDLGPGARRGPHRRAGRARPSTGWPRATGLPLVARFAQGIAVAVERGTPLAEVLHAQAADVREAGRRELIEVAARKEVLMMVPVVFLVLPVTVLFAFWPGVVGLHLTTP